LRNESFAFVKVLEIWPWCKGASLHQQKKFKQTFEQTVHPSPIDKQKNGLQSKFPNFNKRQTNLCAEMETFSKKLWWHFLAIPDNEHSNLTQTTP